MAMNVSFLPSNYTNITNGTILGEVVANNTTTPDALLYYTLLDNYGGHLSIQTNAQGKHVVVADAGFTSYYNSLPVNKRGFIVPVVTDLTTKSVTAASVPGVIYANQAVVADTRNQTGNQNIVGSQLDDRIYTGNGDDVVFAGGGTNYIEAGNGNNQIYASGTSNTTVFTGTGNDTIALGDGTNRVMAGDGNNVVKVGKGNDYVLTGQGNDIIDAGDGTNEIRSGQGNDTIIAGAGNDYIDAGDGADLVTGGSGNNYINAGIGNDTVISGGMINPATKQFVDLGGDNEIYLGVGNDLVQTGKGNDYIDAGMGDDTIIVGIGNNTVMGREGDDLVLSLDVWNATTQTYMSGNNRIYTDAGNDTVQTGNGNDYINTGSNNDIVVAGGGSNYIVADTGNDTIISGGTINPLTKQFVDMGGNSTVYAGQGDDVVQTGSGNDVVDAGDGNNLIGTGSGNDTINASTGTNKIDAGAGNDVITTGNADNEIDAGTGDDRIRTAGGKDAILAGAGNDFVDTGDNNDYIALGDGNDTVYAGNGDDFIEAGAGNDLIYLGQAGKGFDMVRTGSGADTVIGGTGLDGKGVVDYSQSTVAVSIGLDGVAGRGGDAEGDVLRSVIALSGSVFDDQIWGSTNNPVNFLNGGYGNDTVIGSGTDYLGGGAGDDTLIARSSNIRDLDGGTGVDTLKVDIAGLKLDLTVAAVSDGIHNVDRIDLRSKATAETLVLDVNDALYLPDAGKLLTIYGDSNDQVVLKNTAPAGSQWAKQGSTAVDGVTFDIYQGSLTTDNVKAAVLVQSGMKVSADTSAALPTGSVIGTDAANTLTSGSSAYVNGMAGNDTIIGTGAAKLYGGAGDDVIILRSPQVLAVDGGTGRNTLKLESDGIHLDFSNAAVSDNYHHLSVIDMKDGAQTRGETVSLELYDVLRLPAGTGSPLLIQGDSNDTVNLLGTAPIGAAWKLQGTTDVMGVSYNIYAGGVQTDSITGAVLIQANVNVVF